jgi:hypothetical protein
MNARRIAAQLLSSYLLIWAPGTFALEFLATLSSIGARGPLAWIELALHGAVAMFCAVAGRMLRIGAPAATAAAAIAVGARAIMSLQSLLWTALPQDVAPGSRMPLAVLACANAMFWLLMILRVSQGSDRGQTPV